MGAGANMYIAYDLEATKGGTGAGAAKKIPILAGSEIAVNRSSLESQSLRDDRAVAGHKLGLKKPTVTLNLEARSLMLDNMIKLALFGSWSTKTVDSAETVDFDKTIGKITGIGSADCEVGDVIKIANAVAATNNRQWVVKTVALGYITVFNLDKDGTNLMEDATADDILLTVYRRITVGTTPLSAKFEEALVDISMYSLAEMCVCSSFSLDFTPEAIVKASLNFVSGKLDPDSPQSSAYLTATDETQGGLLDGYTGNVYLDGANSNIITAFSLQLENNPEALYAIFNDDANDIKAGRARITGKLSVFLEDASMVTKYNEETALELIVMAKDQNDKGYLVYIPNVKITSAPKSITENNMILNLSFIALPVTGGLGLKIVAID